MAVGPRNEDTVALIIADDLTGACDAGVHFAARGVRTQVPMDARSHAGCDAAVIACNTHTRTSDARVVASTLEPMLTLVKERRPQILLKKIDSTLRGPVEREIAWLLERLDLRMAVLAAAFPAAGRVVRDGRVEIRDSNFVVDIARCFPQMRCAHARREETGALRERIAAEMERGTQVLIVDAESDAELDVIAHTERDGEAVLWAGSGGLARAMAAEVSVGGASAGRPQTDGPVLLCVGSDHCVTAEQVRQLKREMAVVRVRGDGAGMDAARHALENGRDVVLEFSREEIECVPDQALGARVGVEHSGAMIVTGGDTAMHVLQSLGVERLELRAEVEPGIPWSVMNGGAADGKVVVTKSGAFGGRDSLVRCVEWLHPMAARRRKAEAL